MAKKNIIRNTKPFIKLLSLQKPGKTPVHWDKKIIFNFYLVPQPPIGSPESGNTFFFIILNVIYKTCVLLTC